MLSVRDSIPRPLFATTVVSGACLGMGESAALGTCLGAIVGVASFFYPEETKPICTALTALAVTKITQEKIPNSRFIPVITGVLAATTCHFLLSKKNILPENIDISYMTEERINELTPSPYAGFQAVPVAQFQNCRDIKTLKVLINGGVLEKDPQSDENNCLFTIEQRSSLGYSRPRET